MGSLREDQIHLLFKEPLLIFQIFGFMPVQGVAQSHSSSLTFSWHNFRTLYSLFSCAGFVFLMFFQITRLCLVDFAMADIQRFWYSLCSAVGSMLFINMARNWPNFVHRWQLVEKEMFHYGNLLRLRRKIRIICYAFLVMGIVDFILTKLHRIQDEVKEGRINFDLKSWNYFQKDRNFGYVYQFLPYDIFSGILLFILQFQNILSITFVDIFIMLISLLLSTSQQRLTEKIQQMSEAGVFTEFKWKELREDYNRLESFCKFINSHIGPFVVLSYSKNLGAVLILLFYNFITKADLSGKIYLYCGSFIVLFRCMSVCLFGSMINEESRKPLKYLFTVPQAPFNVEIDRLIRQIKADTMALTGLDVFHIKKDIILKIAGSIVTYELVLIQFAGDFMKIQRNGNSTGSF